MLSTQPAGCLISAWFVSYTITLEASLPQSMAWINPDRDVADNDYGVGFAIAGINCVPLHLSPHHFPMQKVEKIRFSTSSVVVCPVRESSALRARYRSNKIISCGTDVALASAASLRAACALTIA